jgi:hypothetical protein
LPDELGKKGNLENLDSWLNQNFERCCRIVYNIFSFLVRFLVDLIKLVCREAM